MDNKRDMPKQFFKSWMEEAPVDPSAKDVVVMREKTGGRTSVETAIQQTALDHLVGIEIIARMGDFPETTEFIRNKLPTKKAVMSGDLGEILASEYIDQCTDFTVPIKRLRWKDDRDTTMRGNDVIAVRQAKQDWMLLKAESKSRARLDTTVVAEAITGLDKHSGRPNPSSLAFISSRLREQGRDADAVVFERFQRVSPKPQDVEHLIFTFSGNDPTGCLRQHVPGASAVIRRRLVGCVVPDHQDFIKRTFATLHARKP